MSVKIVYLQVYMIFTFLTVTNFLKKYHQKHKQKRTDCFRISVRIIHKKSNKNPLQQRLLQNRERLGSNSHKYGSWVICLR
jgi:hypothetical protein